MPNNSLEPAGDIRASRDRTNILKEVEFRSLEYLCSKTPSWISSDMLTFIGFLGGLITMLSCILANYNRYWLILGVFGFFINWLGDSLDGRLAYYRKIPRKWYGWSLDICMDVLTMTAVVFGFYFYLDHYQEVALIFILVYFFTMIIAVLRYKITDEYRIDSHAMGPTELRILFCVMMLLEIPFPGTLMIFGFAGVVILGIMNFIDAVKVIKLGDERDKREKIEKAR